MADLWLAEDLDTRAVVLKTVRADLARSHDVRSAFRREMNITARLHHSHVVHHVAHGSWAGQDMLALAHIRGVSLDRLRGPQLPLAPALLLALDIAEALAYVHALADDNGVPLEIVHGDVSPQNVVVDNAGQALLIDFGAVTTRTMRKPDQLICKPGYMSPEQSRGVAVDARTDQYALGIMLWEMITGRELFCGDAGRRNRPVPPMSTFVKVPPTVEATVVRMLALEREARFPNMAAVADAITTMIPVPVDARSWLASCAREPAPPPVESRTPVAAAVEHDGITVPMRTNA